MSFSNTSEHSVLASRQSQNHFLMLPINRKLSQKTVSTSPLRNLQKGEKCHFQTIRTFVFDLDVASKPFSKLLRTAQFKFKPSSRFFKPFFKILPTTNFKFKPFSRLCLAFPNNGFNFVNQKFAKKKKSHLQTFITFVFDLKVASKPFLKMFFITNFKLKPFLNTLSCMPRKLLQVRDSKIYKKAKKSNI